MTKYPLVFKGVEWRRDGEGFSKYILRLYTGTKQPVRQQVTVVPDNVPFCGVCLSTQVQFSHDRGTWQCLACLLWFDPPPMAGAF